MATRKKPILPTIPIEAPDRNDGQVVLERKTLKTEPPKLYQVVLLNDDYTPMEFVVEVIVEFFAKTREAADQVMLAAQSTGHPLQCVCELAP